MNIGAMGAGLAQNLPIAQLVLYPDSAHGFLSQYPHLFARLVAAFLDPQGHPSRWSYRAARRSQWPRARR